MVSMDQQGGAVTPQLSIRVRVPSTGLLASASSSFLGQASASDWERRNSQDHGVGLRADGSPGLSMSISSPDLSTSSTGMAGRAESTTTTVAVSVNVSVGSGAVQGSYVAGWGSWMLVEDAYSAVWTYSSYSVWRVRSMVSCALSGVVTGGVAVIGAFAGAIIGAIAGRLTNRGMRRGAGLGALAGAVLSMELLNAIRGWPETDRALALLPEHPAAIDDEDHAAQIQMQFIDAVIHEHFGDVVGNWALQVDVDSMGYEQLHQRFGGPVTVPPASPRTINALPCYAASSKDCAFAHRCSICLQEVERGQLLRSLPACCHTYHKKCVDTWLACHALCPLCRAMVVGQSQSQSQAHSQAPLQAPSSAPLQSTQEVNPVS